MEIDWASWQPTVRATLMFVCEEGRVLLIRKKRGFGMGKIHGPGGKTAPDESPMECAIRETVEEVGINAQDPIERGELWFQFTNGLAIQVVVFTTTHFHGEVAESEEAVPIWTDVESIPLNEMWPDNQHWLHRVLTGNETFLGRFLYEEEAILWHEIDWAGK
jgi:8-oxo-dGTP diphosphatase